jgi:putative ABC transport system substrate-binding protein
VLDIGRREFITLLGGAAVAWPSAYAQQAAMLIIAALGGAPNNAEGQARLKAFTEALQGLGRIEGRNVRLDIRLAGDDLGQIGARARAAGWARLNLPSFYFARV